MVGSTTGSIFECVIDSKEKLFSETKERYFKPVYNVGDNLPVTGLEYERFPPSAPPAPPAPKKFFVMATTPTRIYQFVGGPTFEAV